jgi:hypothetical protein
MKYTCSYNLSTALSLMATVFLATVAATFTQAQTFRVNDVRIGDTTVSYLDFEFWQAGNRVCFQDENNNGYVAVLDSLTGNFRTENGKDFLFDQNLAPITSSLNGPEWGLSRRGGEVFYTKQVGRNMHIGRARWNGTAYTATDISDGLAGNRFATIPSKDVGDTDPRLIYATGNLLNLNIFWSEATVTVTDQAVPYGANSSSGPRWIDGEKALLTNDNVGGTTQIFRYETATKRTVQLTFDNGKKIDSFLFTAPDYGNARLLFCTVDDTILRLYHENASAAGRFERVYDVRLPSLAYKYYFSAEPFVFQGKSYLFVCAANEKFIPGSQNNSKPADVWIVALNPDKPLFRKVSDDRTALRLDPEVFITPTEAYIYYYEYKRNGDVHPVAMHKCATGLTANPLTSVREVQQVPASQLVVQPNPVQDVVTISGLEGSSELVVVVVVVNALGQVVMTKSLEQTRTSQNAMLDVSSLPNGMYLLRTIINQHIHTQSVQVFR